MEHIKFTNANGESLEFGRVFPYLFETIEGLGNPEVEILTEKGFSQHGVYYYGSLLNPREILLTVLLRGESILDTRQKVLTLMRVFNPFYGEGVFEYQNDAGSFQIIGAVFEGPVEVTGTGNACVRRFDIGIFCKDPAFTHLIPHQIKLEGFVGGWTLGTTIPFTIGELGPQGAIDYEGSIDSYLLIEFRGEATRPKITKKETGETIELEVELSSDQSLFVNTDPNDKDVYRIIDGERQSAFHYITKESEYPTLSVGQNTFSFSAASGEPEVYLTWYDRFGGIK
jgi:hypothetical protein